MNHPKLTWIPIGIANSMWKHGNLDIFIDKIALLPHVHKEPCIHFFFSISTNIKERTLCKTILEKKGLLFLNHKPYASYLESILHYKFGISPDGNGIDCHRIWEYLYMGIVPVLKRSVFSENLEKLFPCILLNSWDDFDVSYFEKNFSQELDECHKFLKFSYWKDLIYSGPFKK